MDIIDKNETLESIRSGNVCPIHLELGCGERKRNSKAIGIDVLDYPGVDVVGDVLEVLKLLPAGCVDSVHSSHCVEHISDVSALIGELARIVKSGGIVEIVAPHFSNPYFYSDPTHRRFFGLYTFCYWAENSPFSRRVPTYGVKLDFVIQSVDLVFKSSRPFIFRYGLKYLFGKLWNACGYLKELYEENFCYFFPCYEVRYVLRRR